MIIQLTRLVFSTGGALAGLGLTSLVDWSEQIGFPKYLVIILFIILGAAIGFIFGGIAGRELTHAYRRVEDRLRSLSAGELTLGAAGILVGLLIALILAFPLSMIRPRWISFLSIVLVFGLAAYLGGRITFIKHNEFQALFSRRERVGETARETSPERPKYLDTSAIIDGRFFELCRSGFMEGTLRVPRFVIVELHTLADSAEDRKRRRGRRGLDLLTTAQESGARIETFEADYPDLADVDAKLVRLAFDTGGIVITVDHNLTKVARIQKVDAINLNELAVALRPAILPGDPLRVEVVKQGKEADQGVGYLEDGTMIVVQSGRAHIGSEVDSEVTSVLQTSAGRMIFARVKAS